MISVEAFTCKDCFFLETGKQSRSGGIGFSILGMIAATFRYLSPMGGAFTQEINDLAAVLDTVRAEQLLFPCVPTPRKESL